MTSRMVSDIASEVAGDSDMGIDGDTTTNIASNMVNDATAKRKHANLIGDLAGIERRLPAVKDDSVAGAALAEDVSRLLLRGEELALVYDIGKDNVQDYHKAGVRLWNMVLRLEREVPSTPEYREYQRLLVHCRVLALFVIDSAFVDSLATGAESESRSCSIYLYKIAIRAARACGKETNGATRGDSVKLGRLVLNAMATYQACLSRTLSHDKDDGHWDGNGDDMDRCRVTVKHLNEQRTVLEMAQCWREGRHEKANSYFAKNLAGTPLCKFGSSPEIRSELMTALFDIGKLLLMEKKFADAITWLTRALDCFPPDAGDTCDLMDDSDTTDIQKAVMHALASAALGLKSAKGLEKAQDLATRLASFPGGDSDRRVQVLQLRLYNSPHAPTFAADKCAATLLKIVTSFSWTAEEYTLLHYYIQVLHSKSPGLGSAVLDQWMLALRNGDRTGRSTSTEWMEKLVITRVWLLVNQRETASELDTAQALLAKLRISISADAAAATQTLIWKKIEQGYHDKQYGTAKRWCQLALSHIFEAGGRANRPLIERKLILCAVESGDWEAAMTAYTNMNEATRDEPMTKYLVYKLAIQLNDLDLAAECLRCISMSADQGELLQACVLYARHSKQPLFAAQALKKLADAANRAASYDFGEGESDSKHALVHKPALFRCTILMLRDLIEDFGGAGVGDKKARHAQTAIRDLATVFEGVIDAVEMDRDFPVSDKERHFTTEELQWFCKAAYNIGLKHCGLWDLRQTVGILNLCVRISKFLPEEPGGHAPEMGIAAKRLASRFLIASGLAALVRSAASAATVPSDTEQEQMLTDCHAIREHILAFYSEYSELKELDSTGHRPPVAASHTDKLAVLLVFDFESAIRLGDWDDLTVICDRAADCGNSDTLRVLGDTLLRAKATVPSQRFVATMRLVVTKLHAMSNFSNDKLIRYYRCLFQTALYRDNDAAFEVLGELGQLVQAPGDAQAGASPPARAHDDWCEELQYMASIAFNEGIDWFAAGCDEKSRHWVAAAARLAAMSGDGGKLKGTMLSRFAQLGMSDPGPSTCTPARAETVETVKTSIEASIEAEMDHASAVASSPAAVMVE